MKKYVIVFDGSERDQAALKSAVHALNTETLTARYQYTVEYDTSTEKTTLIWWRKPTGGFYEKQSQ